MFHGIAICSLVFFGMDLGTGNDRPIAPKSVPPIVATAIAQGAGNDFRITLTYPQSRWQVVGEVVPKKSWPKLAVEVEMKTKTLMFGGPSALAESRVVDINGKNLGAAQVLKRLKNETPVLVSVSGEMVDPYYLQLTKPDAVIIILGPRDGMPAPELLPTPSANKSR